MTHNDHDPLATQAGALYPKDFVVAIVADAETAEHASSALEESGWAAADIYRLSGPALLDYHEHRSQAQNLVERLAVFLASDEKLVLAQYLDEARRGRHFLFVYAPELVRAQHVAQVVEPFQPLAMYHYGDHTMAELLSPSGRRDPEL